MLQLQHLHVAAHKVVYMIKREKLLSDYKRSNINFLLQVPEHGNLGDQAIALAIEQWLKRLDIKYFAAPAELTDGKEAMYVKKRTPQIYVVPGGGFLGSLWPDDENRFRRILRSFKSKRVIVLPQTITFDMTTDQGRSFFEESKKVYTSHPNLTIFVREKKSLNFMKEYMPTVDVRLAPDLVTTLDIPNYDFIRSGILLCLREDKERNISSEETDYIHKLLSEKLPSEKIAFTSTVVDRAVRKRNRQKEVETKLSEFAHSKLVITDRLHGMVFAALTGTPCIALGNSNGKVKGVYQWIKGKNPYVKYLDHIDNLESTLSQLDLDRKYHYDKSDCIANFQEVVNLLKKENEQ